MAEDRASGLRASLPARIGHYRILERIGRGAMGGVYSARDEVTGRPVALKVLMADLESDPDTRARFYREAQAAARLLHPNIITVFDAGEDQGRSYIAMQLLEGLPLAAYLKRPEAVVLERKLDLMIQVCDGLAAAHAQGIIHRDLKPNNLFVQVDGLLKILDFGVARLADSSMTVAGTLLGTPDYMSPEQARGAQVDVRSDIFSAGSVFHFMLAGRKPFAGPDLPSVLHQLQFEEPLPLPETVPRELAQLISQAMAKSADERPARIEDLLAALVRFRRQYQAETRRLVQNIRALFDEVEAQARSLVESALVLGLPADDESSAPLRQIQERFPPLANGSSGLGSIPFERSHVTAVVQELDGLRQQLTAILATRRAHVEQFDQGQRTLVAGDARTALRQFESVVSACPTSSRAREMVETCRPLARQQSLREEQVARLTGEARHALDAEDWPVAITECQKALALMPNHALASALLIEAEHGVARERRRIVLAIERLLDRASGAMERREFGDADAALREAESMQPGAPGIAGLRRRLTEERAAAEAAELLKHLSDEEIRRARGAFRRGRYDEAVQQLRGFMEVEPLAHEVQLELERLTAMGDAISASAAASRRKSVDLVRQATPLADAGDLGRAFALAREALLSDPTDAEAAAVLDRLHARQLEERIAAEKERVERERTLDAAPILAAAQTALDRGYVSVALKVAVAAQCVAPRLADTGTLVEAARMSLASEDRDTFDLSLPPLADPVVPPPPAIDVPSQRSSDRTGALDWAAGVLRGTLRRGRA